MTNTGRINGNLNLSRSLGDLKYKGDHSRPPAQQLISARAPSNPRDRDARTGGARPLGARAQAACRSW